MKPSIGLDFGTTNSAIARVDDSSGSVRVAKFPHAGGVTDTFRSVLYFHPERRTKMGEFVPLAGPVAIEQYLGTDDGQGRLIQSIKSYLADAQFDATAVFGRPMKFVELLTLLISDLRTQAERDFGEIGERAVVGRPVRFSHAETAEDDLLAETRLRSALHSAGFTDVTLVPEPVAAAFFYERRLDHDEIVLVGDFGGGTSDFTLAKVGPTRRKERANGVLATSGVALAGDAIDARIVDHVVAPAVGKGTTYRSMFGKTLDVPVWLFSRLRRWHHLSFLKTRPNLALLDEIIINSNAPEAIQMLRDIIDNDEGYKLYRAVERAKVALSREDETLFLFDGASARIEKIVARRDLEEWISDETSAMAAAVDRALSQANLRSSDVDRVFLTGGTSFVPAVRSIFEKRFGKDRLESGGEMISVASGLALMASQSV